MELEEWIQQDIKRFLNEMMPDAKTTRPIRKEELSLVDNKDYQRLIRDALQSNRYRHATELFDELKQKFVEVPLDHQQERKAYYRILQKCYKLIFDYVSDSHKTARILSQLEYRADVFDSKVKPISIEMLGRQVGEPIRPVELVMIQAPSKQEHVELPKMPGEKVGNKEEATEETKKEPEKLEQPPTPAQPPIQVFLQNPPPPVYQAPPTIETPKNITIHVKHLNLEDDKNIVDEAIKADNRDPRAPKPSWAPPNPYKPMKKPATTTKHFPRRQIDERVVSRRSAKEFLRRAHVALLDKNLSLAQELLMEARMEMQRAGGDLEILRRITNLERSVAQHLSPQNRARADQEIFSGTYMQGVHAMAAGDYKAAANLFYQRIQQAPADRAARIRLAECMEVLYGQSN